MVMDFEDESTWLLHRVLRLRIILRYVKDPRAESGLRELIAEAEQRLEQLEAMRRTKAANELKAAD
jgi:peptide subunit release factor 1 (eRF1)